MSDEKLKSAYGAHVTRNAPADRSACPTPEQLETLAARNDAAGDSASIALLDHVFSCRYCGEDFALLRTVNAASGAPMKSRSSLQIFARVAAAAVLLLAIGVSTRKLMTSSDTIVRDSSDGAAEVLLIAPSAETKSTNVGKFVWRNVAGASAYELEILDAKGTVVVTRVTSDSTLQLSTEDAARVAALSSFDWFVTARRADGNERRSTIGRVVVKAGSTR